MTDDLPSRLLVLAGGLAGAAGVALSAAAAHGDAEFIGTAASISLAHAPAILAIGLLGANRVLRAGGLVLVLGLLVFCGDLVMRHYTGARLFPFAAPIGGSLLILGWLVVVASSAFGRKTRL